MNRRHFLRSSAALTASPLFAGESQPTIVSSPGGKAEHCIFIWLGGGMAQMDTFDPKKPGNNKATPKLAGSLYPAIDTAVPNVQVCEHLKNIAPLMERMTVVSTLSRPTSSIPGAPLPATPSIPPSAPSSRMSAERRTRRCRLTS
jgi:hypothetical protein